MPDEHIFNKSAGDRAFWLTDGKKIDTIMELHDFLSNMTEDVFLHHVNSDRNDFGSWINGVFHEEKLAKRITGLSSRKKIKLAMGQWMKNITVKEVKKTKKIKKEDKKHIIKEEVKKKVILKEHSRKNTIKKEKRNKKEGVIKKIIEEDLEGLNNPKKFLAGVVDFILGFIVGILSMLIFLNLIG